jgi:hypothetical protein
VNEAGTAARTCVSDGWDPEVVAMSVDAFAGAGRLWSYEMSGNGREGERDGVRFLAFRGCQEEAGELVLRDDAGSGELTTCLPFPKPGQQPVRDISGESTHVPLVILPSQTQDKR